MHAEQLKRLLIGNGHRVRVAVNGREALAAVRKRKPELIVSDIVMPEMDGYEMCAELKANEDTSDVPIILLTSLSSPNDVIEALNVGADYFLHKPLDERYLLSKIASILSTPAELEREEEIEAPLAVKHDDKEYIIKCGRRKLLDFLLSTYEVAVRQNADLTKAKFELGSLNEQLEERVQARTAKLLDEIATRMEAEEALNVMNQQLTTQQQALRKRQRELEELNEELQKSTLQVVQAAKLSALGELAAGVAHELNQPLNVVKVISQSILRDIDKDRFDEHQAQQDLPEIVTQVNKMAEIIDHMRVFSRPSGGMLNESVDLNDVIRETFKFMSRQLVVHNIAVVKELAEDLPEIPGDPVQLEQVVVNMITNAASALEDCDREVKEIRIGTHRHETENAVVIEIRDNGSGMSEKMQQEIFQPFFTTKEPSRGTGLGLSVSNRIIQNHNGRIELDSEIGRGTTFRIILPEK